MDSETISYWQNGLLWITASQILTFLGSVFSSPFGIALAGAGFGAWGAGLVTRALKAFDDKMLELRRTNAAAGICGTICNSYIGTKKDFITPLSNQYSSQLKTYVDFHAARKAGTLEDDTLHLRINFQKFTQEPVAPERLQDLIFENLGSTIKVLHVTIALVGAMKTVEGLSKERNEYIDAWQSGKFGENDGAAILRYLGQRFPPDGHRDEIYKDYVTHLVKNTDDCIHFSDFLMNMLHGRAIELRAKLEKRTLLSWLRKPHVPKLEKWDFSSAKAEGMFPDPSEYKSFHAGLGQGPI